jgi:peptidoglycan-associated lipoprotein
MSINALLRCAGVVLVCVTLAACASSKKSSGGPASVEDRGISPDENAAIDEARARAQGVEGSGELGGSPLDDPTGNLSVRTIYFDYDSDAVRVEFRPVVEAHANYLATHPNTAITLEGHADERGSREYNLALGERRALSVRRQMVLLGASAVQIRTVSYGEERPVVEGHDEESYAQNRRVEILY